MAAISSISTPVSATSIDDASFDRVVDVVDDLGIDPNVGARIDSIVRNAAASGVRLEFPSGTYTMGSLSLRGLNGFGLCASDGANVTIRAPGRLDSNWLRFPNGRNILIEGITFDLGPASTGGTFNLQMPGPWVVRDCHKVGKIDVASYRLAVEDANATGQLIGCTARDGTSSGGRGQGIFVPTNHAGSLTIQDCIIENHSDNGIYGSPPYKGKGGEVHVVGGLYRNNNIDGVRVGSSGSSVRDVVVINDEVAPTFHGSTVQRGIWVRQPGKNITIENNDVSQIVNTSTEGILLGSGASGGSGTVRNNRIRQETGRAAIKTNSETRQGYDGSGNHVTGSGNRTAPSSWVACSGDGCDEPRTEPRNARSSGNEDGDDPSEGDDSPDLPNLVTFDGTPGVRSEYAFSVDGEIEKTTDGGASINDEDLIEGNGASGFVWGGTDAYRFSGDVIELEADDGLTVELNGEEVAPADFGTDDEPADDPSSLVTFTGTPGVRSEYAFSVDGAIEKSTEDGASINDGDEIVDGTEATGFVWAGTDAYRFSGDVVTLDADDPITVELDGEEVAPADFGTDTGGDDSDGGEGGGTTLPHRITINGDGNEETSTEYMFTVNGDLEKASLAESEDTVDGNGATGTVHGGRDSFNFSGSLTDLQVDGRATVTFQENDV